MSLMPSDTGPSASSTTKLDETPTGKSGPDPMLPMRLMGGASGSGHPMPAGSSPLPSGPESPPETPKPTQTWPNAERMSRSPSSPEIPVATRPVPVEPGPAFGGTGTITVRAGGPGVTEEGPPIGGYVKLSTGWLFEFVIHAVSPALFQT